MGGFPLIHPIGAALPDHAFAITHDDIFMPHAHRLDEFGAGNGGGASAVYDDADFPHLTSGQRAGVDQPGGGDDGGAMLVIMKDGDVHPLFQRLFDDEAIGRGDVFQIDAAKAWAHQSHRVDKGFGIFGIEFQINRINISKAFEQDRLALHHRFGGQRAEIAEAKDGCAVGDDGDEIALCRIFISKRRIFSDGAHGDGDAG